MYQPKTGEKCSCKPGVCRNNCPNCEGTGWKIDFQAIRDQGMEKLKNKFTNQLRRRERYLAWTGKTTVDYVCNACKVAHVARQVLRRLALSVRRNSERKRHEELS